MICSVAMQEEVSTQGFCLDFFFWPRNLAQPNPSHNSSAAVSIKFNLVDRYAYTQQSRCSGSSEGTSFLFLLQFSVKTAEKLKLQTTPLIMCPLPLSGLVLLLLQVPLRNREDGIGVLRNGLGLQLP